MAKLSAFIFDLNGTMIDDMAFHLKAWFRTLNEDLHAGLTLDEVKKNMYGKNEELLDRVFGKGHFTKAQADAISLEKEKIYQQEFRPHLQLIAGLPAFLERAAKNNIFMAIGSAAIPFNIDYILDNLSIRHYFKTIVSADEVAISKPHPEVFLKAAAQLGVSPESCLVFEDVPKGVEAALNAGINCVTLTTTHAKEEFHKYPNILHYVADYTDPALNALFN